MGTAAGVAVLAVLAAVLAGPESFHLAKASREKAPPCATGTPDHPADWRRCQGRVVTGAAKPKPYPIIPSLFSAPGKP